MASKEKVLLAVRIDIPPEVEEEFNRWYNQEHVPNLLGVPGVLSGRRYVVKEGKEGLPKYMALYELESEGVMKTEAFSQAADTEWTRKMRPHFRNQSITFYRQIFPED